jgi:hypothetical protein
LFVCFYFFSELIIKEIEEYWFRDKKDEKSYIPTYHEFKENKTQLFV